MNLFDDDVHFRGNVTFGGQVRLPEGCVDDDTVAAGAGIDATKSTHQFSVDCELFDSTTTIANKTRLLHIVRGSTGTIVGFEAAVVTKATAGDKTVSVDLKKSTGGGAFATILTAPISFSDASSNLTAVAAAIASANLADGDLLCIVVTAAGSTGTQALGLLATLTMQEAPL